MVTLKHPHFPDRVSVEVEPEDVDRWVASGWLAPVPRPEPAQTHPAPKPGPKRGPKSPSIGDD